MLAAPAEIAAGAGGRFELTVVDGKTGKPIACRMHLRNDKGKPRKVGKLPFWHDHFVFDGTVTLDLPRGEYEFEIERGPEYLDRKGHFTISDFADDRQQIELNRAVDMADEGWWSGDLHIHRDVDNIELLVEAEDLHIAPVITWWNDKNHWKGKKPPANPIKELAGRRYVDLMAGEDEREGGALLFFGLKKPLDIAGASREYPSPMQYLLEAKKEPGVWIDIEKPFWWDLPIWLASGKVDSIGIAHNHMNRSEVLNNEAWGRARDRKQYPGADGNGRWTQDIYYHVLNTGLRIPPSAGSASGVLPNPVGYDRMYVWVDPGQFNYKTWWESFRAGRVMVTNGPLLRPRADGRLPGQVFTATSDEGIDVRVTLDLTTRDSVRYLELIQNGEVAHRVALDEFAKEGQLPLLRFRESGWCLVRIITENQDTFRFASSAPWYVEIDGKPRISRRSVQFFLDWLEERAARVKLDDPKQKAEVIEHFDAARRFWKDKLAAANVE